MRQHHHIRIDAEFKLDCNTWIQFLHARTPVARPFVDFNKSSFSAEELKFHTDAIKATHLGFGGVFNNSWLAGKWEENYIHSFNSSIEYLELYALVVTVVTRQKRLRNKRGIIFCGNKAVMYWINGAAAK